jgi:hypothetical protein
MPQVALVANPRKRRRRKMSALQRKYFGKRRHRRHRASSHRRRRRVATITVRANPRRRHRRHYAVHHRRYRRNPGLRIGGAFRRVIPTIQAGAIGAVGGLLNDVAYGFAKSRLPAALQAGWGRTGTKAVLAVFVGILGNFVLRGKGNQLAVGAATVVIHEALKEQLATLAPQLPLGDLMDGRELGYVDPAAQITDQSDGGQGAYMEQGAYMDGMDQM